MPSPIFLSQGDLLVMVGEDSTSSELLGPQVNLTRRWLTQHTPTCRALRAGVCWALSSRVQGLHGLDTQKRRIGISMPLWGLSFPWTVVVACFVLAYASGGGLREDVRAGWRGDNGECRGVADRPIGGVGHILSLVFSTDWQLYLLPG